MKSRLPTLKRFKKAIHHRYALCSASNAVLGERRSILASGLYLQMTGRALDTTARRIAPVLSCSAVGQAARTVHFTVAQRLGIACEETLSL